MNSVSVSPPPVIASEAKQSPLSRLLSARADKEHADTIALSVALLELRNNQGHSYALIDEFAGQPLPFETEENVPLLPEEDAWLDVLQTSALVGDGTGDEPLVLLNNEKLQFARFYHAEQRIWQGINNRLAQPPDEKGLSELKPMIQDLFGPPPEGTDINWQAVAAVSALRHRFCVITGGPGTGKTFTVARVLALLLAREPDLRIALAAPTGKAANRLTESIRDQLGDLPVSEGIKARLGTEAKTIHRLLKYIPVRDSFSFNKKRWLDADILVVDEVSMVGLMLMDGLLEAMPPEGRVIILGDEYQLPSVDAGDLLAEICREAETDEAYGEGFARTHQALTGEMIEPEKVATPLRDAVIRLKHSYRFGKDSGIGLLTEAVRVRDTGRALEILKSDEYPEVTRRDLPERVEDIFEPLIPLLQEYLKSKTPEEALRKLNEFRLLTATRVGKWGSIKLNQYIETWLRRSRLIGPGRHYYAKPVMVTQNDYQTNLFNGDVGVCWPVAGKLKLFFPKNEDELKKIPLSKLPSHEPAWALTVHKSQGSDFDRVLLLMSGTNHFSYRDELIYTGLTRAREQVIVCFDIKD